MTVIDRILKFIAFKGINKSKFYKETGLSNGFLDKVKDVGVSKIEYILSSFPEINPLWLLTGEGEMIKQAKSQALQEPVNVYAMRTDETSENQTIPLYNIEASAGLVELFRHHNDEEAIDTISIPHLPKCDGAIYVTGDSMYPLLKSGDIIMYKEIHNILDGLFWGEMYLISLEMDGEEFISVKYIQKSDKGDQYIKLVSQNSHHQPREVKLDRIKALALVKASIRINSMH